MKKIIIITVITMALALCSVGIFAQSPPHPTGGNAPGGSAAPVGGGGAPIDGGLTFLLIMGAAYGGKKFLKRQEPDAK